MSFNFLPKLNCVPSTGLMRTGPFAMCCGTHSQASADICRCLAKNLNLDKLQMKILLQVNQLCHTAARYFLGQLVLPEELATHSGLIIGRFTKISLALIRKLL